MLSDFLRNKTALSAAFVLIALLLVAFGFATVGYTLGIVAGAAGIFFAVTGENAAYWDGFVDAIDDIMAEEDEEDEAQL